MKYVLTFVIAVRHPANARDWQLLKSNLSQTINSISAQRHNGWRAVIAANRGADLPSLPKGFDVAWVDFPPNPLHERGDSSLQEFYDAIRLDKGRRILAGLLQAGAMGHVMVVDDDDLVSSRLTGFVDRNPSSNGWYVRDGYLWSGGQVMSRYSDFSQICGTSHIIRSDLYRLPQTFVAADDDYIRTMLGSHVQLCEIFQRRGTPLEPLPFPGAVYRIGHPGAHSMSSGVLRRCFSQKICSGVRLSSPEGSIVFNSGHLQFNASFSQLPDEPGLTFERLRLSTQSGPNLSGNQTSTSFVDNWSYRPSNAARFDTSLLRQIWIA